MACGREADGVYGWRCIEPCKMKWAAREGEDYRPPLCLMRAPKPSDDVERERVRASLVRVPD